MHSPAREERALPDRRLTSGASAVCCVLRRPDEVAKIRDDETNTPAGVRGGGRAPCHNGAIATQEIVEEFEGDYPRRRGGPKSDAQRKATTKSQGAVEIQRSSSVNLALHSQAEAVSITGGRKNQNNREHKIQFHPSRALIRGDRRFIR
jgi:hypothetical protein